MAHHWISPGPTGKLSFMVLGSSGHILTGKLTKSCRTHAGVPVPALVAGEAASVPRPWPDKPRSIHSLLVLTVPMAAAGMGSWGMDPVNDGGDPLSLWG